MAGFGVPPGTGKLPTRTEAAGGTSVLQQLADAGLTQAEVEQLAADQAAGLLNQTNTPGGPVNWGVLSQLQQAGLTQAQVVALGNTPPTGTGIAYDQNGNPVSTQDAVAILTQELTSWGFGQDAVNWATQQIQSNDSVDQILYSLRQQPFYQNSIFGQVGAARTKANLPAMTEAQILSYQDYAIGVAQQAGLPAGFITTPELVNLMGNDVSTSELDARITQGYVAALKSDPNTLNALQTYFGVTPGQLAAYYLDPQRALPLIQQQFAAAQMGGAATTTGYGPISESQAMLMAQLGTTQTQAETGFTDLAKKAQLFNALPGEGVPGITQDMQLAAEFGGNAQDQLLIQQRGQQRAAAFAGNYHFAETQNRGITGLGSVPRNG